MRRMFKIEKSLILSILIFCSCGKHADRASVTVTYTESTEDFPNPERGFYHPLETTASGYKVLDASILKGYRTPKTSHRATYAVVSTLVFRDFVLDNATNGPIPDPILTNIKTDLATARTAGVKLIMRFSYTTRAKAGNCHEGFICPPYGDAPKQVILQQIDQLKPVFHDNADVIACVQLGFIGTWGEGYYTDHFGDPSTNAQNKLIDQNWADRNEVLKALLDATPKEIMIQVRVPQAKQRFAYGVTAPTNSPALTEAEAFSDSDKARVAFHNDCFLASVDDYNTFKDYGNSHSPAQSANKVLRDYFAADSKYGPVGGETCSDEYSPQNDCAPAGQAEAQMGLLHYSFLNTSYNNDVNNDWVDGGCMDNIKKNLGYRFVLTTASYSASIKSSDSLTLTIQLKNTGYASPYKSRPVQLIMINTSTQEKIVKELSTDIRRWYSGTVTLKQRFLTGASAGQWKLYLNLPDASASINTRPEYSIRIANNNMWSDVTGYNDLGHTVTIE